MKVVKVLERDNQGVPFLASVRDEQSDVAVVCEYAQRKWNPLFGLKGDDPLTLPSCFRLNDDCIVALNLSMVV